MQPLPLKNIKFSTYLVMSSVIVCVGQCGNQINYAMWTLLKPHLGNLNICNGDGKFPAVNVDTECKVIKRLWNEFGIRYNKSSLIAGVKGCGSNWAVGYYGNKDSHQDSLLGRTLAAIRKETERCSSFSGIILIHSLAGGTGSGLGSLLHQKLRDEYPMNYILSCAVAPHEGGESPLQHYNASLCLASVHETSDCVLLFENDEVLLKSRAVCGRKEDRKTGASEPVSLVQSNQYIAQCIAELILPTDSVSSSSMRCAGLGLEPWELVRSVCPMPTTKFIHASCTRCCAQNIVSDAVKAASHRHGDGYCTNISAVFVIRGSVPTFSVNSVVEQMKFVNWNPFPVDLWTAKANPLTSGKLTSLAAVTNCTAVVPFLERIITKARIKFSANAYLHWYTKHGCTNDDFLDAFTNLDSVIASYNDVIR